MFFCIFILTYPPLVSNEKRRFTEKKIMEYIWEFTGGQ